MRVLGILLWVVAFLLLVGASGMETSVPTGTGSRVHNIGLMRAQENTFLLGIGIFIAGTIFIALGGKGRASRHATNESNSAQGTRKCPFCAENIKVEAIVCRFCQRDLPATQVSSHPTPDSSASYEHNSGKRKEQEKLGEGAVCETVSNPASSGQRAVMEKYGVEFKDGKFVYEGIQYARLSDIPFKSTSEL